MIPDNKFKEAGMQKVELLNEIKLMELKLQALKAQVESREPMVKEQASAQLYGLLKGGDDNSRRYRSRQNQAERVRLSEQSPPIPTPGYGISLQIPVFPQGPERPWLILQT
jgi:hypothetical protein